MIRLGDMNWVHLDEKIRQGMQQQNQQIIPLTPGLEADVMCVRWNDQSYVLKIWNKESRPDIGKQYHLLLKLGQSGIQVSRPYGWGKDQDHNQVLLTSYDGIPVTRLDQKVLRRMACTLNDIHQYPFSIAHTDADTEASKEYIPRCRFVDYFFPQIDKHADIYDRVNDVVQRVQIRQDHLIHGDYNLGNIVEMNGQHTVIDWTNGQYGDPRYDTAWSVFLITIYNGEEYGKLYRDELRTVSSCMLDEERAFEALAWLRWVLLSREGDVPRNSEVMRRMLNIAAHNLYLHTSLL
ncbi:aminoglycoside phosphotransferase family protein [Paenibacillus sp. FSL R7-0652]|uniref:aminoglycoside phosphotransferase family protein n=1 Tax=Paenibacillus sp. FSL R7-0652 TaxID=2921687 RepID=UPI00315A5BDC